MKSPVGGKIVVINTVQGEGKGLVKIINDAGEKVMKQKYQAN